MLVENFSTDPANAALECLPDSYVWGTATTTELTEGVKWFLEREVSLRLDRFSELHNDLSRMESLSSNWDSYGAEPPGATAIENARKALMELERADIYPNAVVPSAEGGVGIVFVRSARYADIEFLNDGDILMSAYHGEEPAVVLELASPSDIVGTIRRYIST